MDHQLKKLRSPPGPQHRPSTLPMLLIWPSYLLRAFEDFHNNMASSLNSLKRGGYSGVLLTLFSACDGFAILHHRVTVPAEPPDCIMIFEIQFKHKPVLVVGVEPSDHIHSPSAREAADTQIQSRINDLAGWLWLPCPMLSGN